MFGHGHYVPVMRTKPAELRALRSLDPTLRSLTTPMLECLPRTFRTGDSPSQLEAKIEDIVSHLSGWSGRSVFLDFDRLRFVPPDSVEVMAARTARAGIRPVLVVSLKSQPTYIASIQTVLHRHGSSICLRISPEELNLSAIEDMIGACLRRFRLPQAQVDLVIDRGGIDSCSVTYQEFARNIPSIDSWRTLTLLAGSFPKDLEGLAPGQTHRLRRFEWRQWSDLDSWPGRRPAFGDYTIQHVYFKEPVQVPNCSASVRYTIEDKFFILRGEGVLNEGGPGRGQWNAWAALLIEMPEFFGKGFSPGDGYIADRAANWDNTGTPQTWLQAGFSHHLTTAALQVAGRLEHVRQVSRTVSDWASVVHVDRPEAIW